MLSKTTKLVTFVKIKQIMAQIRNVYNNEDLTHTPTHPPSNITSSYFDAKVDTQNQLHLQQRE